MRHRLALAAGVIVCLAIPAPAFAKLPKPKTKLIVPGKSIAGVKLDMTQAQVFRRWGSTRCTSGVCEWAARGPIARTESATVSLVDGKVVGIFISAATRGNNLKFKPGVLSKWQTAKHIALGSKKSAVPRAYPAAKPNTGEAVQGFDLFAGARPNLSYTRFSTFGIGATPTLLRTIEVAWDACHYYAC